jgi:DNA-binding beta-propeller fold protein YncE
VVLRSLPNAGREIDAASSWLRFILAGGVLAGLIYLAVRWITAVGWRQGTALLSLGLFAILFALTVRASFTLNYVNYDMATEYLVYAHASPDVKRALAEIDSISERTVGDKNIVVAYDDESSWPLSWYMREYPNARFYGENPDSNAMSAPVVIVGPKNRDKVRPYVERDYSKRTYRLIWWPDMDYFNLNWEKIRFALTDPQQRERLWQIALFRRHRDTADFSKFRDLTQWPARHEFDMWVRKDLATQVWDLNVTPSAASAEAQALLSAPEAEMSANPIYGGVYDGLALVQPRAVAVAPNGDRVIADTGNNRIVVVDAAGNEKAVFGTRCELSTGECADPDAAGPLQPGDGGFYEPWGVAVDLEGNIYVADTWNGRIQVFSSEGEFLRKWGVFNTTNGELGDPNSLFGPRGLAVDLDGNLVVADTGNKRILRYSPAGAFVDQVGGGGVIAGRFDEPTSVAVDPTDGSILVADAWNRRIQRFDTALAFVAEWAVPGWESQEIFHKPSLTVVANGDVYATDPQIYRVFVFDREGTIKATFGRFGAEANQFGLPNGIAADLPGSSVVVADADNNRVMVFATLP